jgi:SAM-dependent methyltransferase
VITLGQREAFRKRLLSRKYREYLEWSVLREIEPGLPILDIGCGEGLMLESLRGEVAVGLDLCPANVKICQERGLEAYEGDACDLPAWVDRHAWGTCLLTNVLEHLVRPEQALEEIREVLLPGGRLIVLIPNDPAFKRARWLLGRKEEAEAYYGHEREWDPGSLRSALVDAGLQVRKMVNLPLLVWGLSLHCLAVAERE